MLEGTPIIQYDRIQQKIIKISEYYIERPLSERDARVFKAMTWEEFINVSLKDNVIGYTESKKIKGEEALILVGKSKKAPTCTLNDPQNLIVSNENLLFSDCGRYVFTNNLKVLVSLGLLKDEKIDDSEIYLA